MQTTAPQPVQAKPDDPNQARGSSGLLLERSKEDQSRVELGMSMRVILVGVCAVTAPVCARERVLVFTVSAELFPFPKKPVRENP